ncbi:caspase family protein, partial [bacterium]|nr:caspase family protein [bacterium]
MRKSRVFVFIVLSFLTLTVMKASAATLLTVMEADATTRTALVIGNGAYKSAPLKNPVNDAEDMANVLTESGFKVTLKINASQREMETAVRIFGKVLRKGGIGLFYYAGHGLQLNGINYLIPVDAQIETESDVKYETIDAGRILGKMEDAGNNMNIIILDACRNNPFARSFRTLDKGLAKMDAPTGSLIAYATAPGRLASDGDGRNGVYTKHLIRNIRNPDLKIEELFKNVRMAVVENTSKKQVPWESSSLMGTFYFKSRQPGQNNRKQTINEKRSTESSYEIVFWESIKNSTDAESFKVYLQQFPSGVFAGLAELRIKQFAKKSKINKTTSSIKISKKIKQKPPKKRVKVASISHADKEPTIIARDGQSIKYKNRIVYDKNSSLEWIAGPSFSNVGIFPT